MKVLAVTGGLGSGKSTACHFFRELGCEIFDADIEAKRILFANETVKQQLLENFGREILVGNEIDKSALSNIVFKSHHNQSVINAILHPLVMEKFLSEKNHVRKNVYIMDAALVFEANLQKHFDKTILIYAEWEIRLQRALSRGNLTKEQILYRMNLQMDEEKKKSLADIIVSNNGPVGELKNKIHELYKNLV